MHQAINKTYELLQDMGAKIAPNKSFVFSNRTQARKWYTKHVLVNISACILVVRSVRDLGGTIHTVGKSYAKVIDARIVQSLSTLRKFRHLPHDGKTKALFIQSKILQATPYGIESAEPSGHLLRKLQSGIAGVLGSQSAWACNALTFDLNNYGIDLDPHIQQFTRRVSLTQDGV
jgi:hypothetical protein